MNAPRTLGIVRAGRSVTQCSPTTGLGEVCGVSSSCASLSGALVATFGSAIMMRGEVRFGSRIAS